MRASHRFLYVHISVVVVMSDRHHFGPGFESQSFVILSLLLEDHVVHILFCSLFFRLSAIGLRLSQFEES